MLGSSPENTPSNIDTVLPYLSVRHRITIQATTYTILPLFPVSVHSPPYAQTKKKLNIRNS